eukprot:CAMPEP_0114564030 /NCGR_PEP_ID=MMETSP0114-20121206/13465_1 /TAXON_ID=31324 /ORGANISM="Goniomonas sp, Strain m" /LENGTH=122 /DNA_ID=CAMNT_0001749995 /DNA_START=430 /DNA_END=795 /DNA_ORIENTATION=+
MLVTPFWCSNGSMWERSMISRKAASLSGGLRGTGCPEFEVVRTFDSPVHLLVQEVESPTSAGDAFRLPFCCIDLELSLSERDAKDYSSQMGLCPQRVSPPLSTSQAVAAAAGGRAHGFEGTP